MAATVLAVGVLVTIGLLVCSAFFSSAETAMFSLPANWIETHAAANPRAAPLQELRADPHRLLVTLLVGNNVVNIAIASIVTILIGGYLPAGPAVILTTIVTSTIVLLFGEIIPKSYGLGNAGRWAVRTAPIVRIVEVVLWPPIVAFDWLTRRLSRRLGAEPEIERPYLD